jgi:translation initiation factor 1
MLLACAEPAASTARHSHAVLLITGPSPLHLPRSPFLFPSPHPLLPHPNLPTTLSPSLPSPRADFGSANDPFASGSAGLSKSKVHIRVQQRNGRKCITSIEGLEDDLDLKRICKAMKRSFNCNGNVAAANEEASMGEVIQLQGDQRDNAKEWLLAQEIILPAEADRIVVHGF